MSDDAQRVGDIIDGLGCETTLREGDLIAGAVVVLKVIQEDGSARLNTCWSDGMAWFERVGMLRIAEQMDHPTDHDRDGDDE